MSNIKGHFKLYDEPPVFQLLVALLIMVVTGALLPFVFSAASGVLTGLDSSVQKLKISDLGVREVAYMRILFVVQEFSMFILPGVMILRLLQPGRSWRLKEFRIPLFTETILIFILALSILPITNFTGQLNSMFHLPESLASVEQWMIKQENHANDLIKVFITSENFAGMLLSILTVALLPAMGEELIFRGVIQRIFYGFFSSRQAAIWLTAIIFSTLHFQFFGFLPRLILGLIYGYLFLWSRNLWLPVLAHFVNNSIPVILFFIKGPSVLEAGQDLPLWKSALSLPVPVTLCVLILIYFRRRRNEHAATGNDK